MYLDYSLEMYITILAIATAFAGCLLIVRADWRHWGPLFLSASLLAIVLCYIFVRLHFYSFPYNLLKNYFLFPILVVGHVFPLLVLLGVKYSPAKWSHKIAFYWVFVVSGMAGETLAHNYTRLIKYELFWDFWDSLTAWWLYLLLFEWIGGKLIPPRLRRPLPDQAFAFGGWAWLIVHFFMVAGFILAGVYLGWQLGKEMFAAPKS